MGAFRPHNHAARHRGCFNLRTTAMPPMLCCVSASVQSLMLFPCHHVSACGAFDSSCGGVHHVEHLFFFLWSHTFRPVKPNLAPVLWRSLRCVLRSNLSSVRTIKKCKQQQFMATHYCYGAPRTEVSEHPSLPLDIVATAVFTRVVLIYSRIFACFLSERSTSRFFVADVLARPSPNMIKLFKKR